MEETAGVSGCALIGGDFIEAGNDEGGGIVIRSGNSRPTCLLRTVSMN